MLGTCSSLEGIFRSICITFVLPLSYSKFPYTVEIYFLKPYFLYKWIMFLIHWTRLFNYTLLTISMVSIMICFSSRPYPFVGHKEMSFSSSFPSSASIYYHSSLSSIEILIWMTNQISSGSFLANTYKR